MQDLPPLFALPVDAENRATELRPLSAAAPHMLAFHLSWISLFSCFLSAFSFPPLLPVLRDALSLTDTSVSHAGVASALGTLLARLAAGPACDLLGPRVTSAAAALLSAPAVFLAATASSSRSFVLLRFFSGFSLAAFVSNQYWMSSMFSPSVVGVANGVSAGWANAGAAAAQLFMPLVYSLLSGLGLGPSTAWRAAFFVPAALQVGTALAVLAYGQDLPDGPRYCCSFSSRKKSCSSSSSGWDEWHWWKILLNGFGNYRGWVMGLTYACCYGVELTMENIVAGYFYDRFGLGVSAAGATAAVFGMANVVARPGGGMLSDALARRFGMRGRLWGLWAVETGGGLLCVLLGRMSSLAASVAAMVGFSLFLQAASGLTFGVVPFISRRSLGVISGMTASGGPLGAVVTQLLFFSGSDYSTETGISLMGIMSIACTLSVSLIYFPRWGGMFCGPSASGLDVSDEDYFLLK